MSEPAPEPEKARLDVSIKLRELPAHAAELRIAGAADDARNEQVARPRIEAHIAACRLVCQVLQSFHTEIADTRDLDLTGYSRPAAVWLLSGRCLGLLHAILVQVGAGVCTEVMVTGRALHEANHLLFVLGDTAEDELLRLWLDDEGRHNYVKPSAVRDAHERYESVLNRALAEKGMPELRASKPLVSEMYDRFSRTAHNRRSSCVDALWEPARRMFYGYSPSAIRRAGYATWAASMTTETASYVGEALRGFYGNAFFSDHIRPLLESITAIREAQPLDEQTVREAAGTA